ncbi:MAG TPA: FHA domain-containing protein [Candidatus Nanoarchaeia archaeon]|nr:FHA domain-containing protein [Candidatus Nanoarchaeia archaeon]
MKRAILEDIPAKQKHNLGELIRMEGKVTLGRENEYSRNTINLGVDSGHEKVNRISRRHAEIRYDLKTDTYLLEDALSKNGTEIEREKTKITMSLAPMPLQDGDNLYFGSYGPVIFTQKEQEKRKDDRTRVSVFE